MATVSNAYFQSPWIADAARNLASALRPPDPQEQIARERAKWEFEHAQSEAQYLEGERERYRQADSLMGDLAKLTENPVVNPLTGEIDVNETRRQAGALLGQIYEAGGWKYVKPSQEVAGPLSASFMADKELAQQKLDANEEIWGRRFSNALTMQNRGFEHSDSSREDDQAFKLQYLQEQQAGRLEELNMRLAAIAKNKNSPPLTITPAMGAAITKGIYARMLYSGKQLQIQDINRLVDEVAADTQDTRNYATSLERVWNARFGENVMKQKGVPWWKLMSGYGDMYLTPDFDNPIPSLGGAPAPTDQTTPPAAEPPRTFGGAATGADLGAPPELPPAAAPVAAEPPAAAPPAAPSRTPPRVPRGSAGGGAPPAKLLKEGIETTFKGKGTWTLKNGVPTRVK